MTEMTTKKILVVDDEENIRFTFSDFLCDQGYQVDTAATLDECMGLLEANRYDTIFLDIMLGRDNGFDVLRRVNEIDPICPVVMITGSPQIDTAAEAVRCGAFDYIPKPVRQDALIKVAATALTHKVMASQKEDFRLRMEAVFRCVNEGIIIFDRNLTIVEINAAARSIFAADAAVVGQSLAQLDDRTTGILKRFEALVAARGESELYRYEFADGGSKKILSLTLTPLTSLSGDAQGMVMIVRDETLLQDS